MPQLSKDKARIDIDEHDLTLTLLLTLTLFQPQPETIAPARTLTPCTSLTFTTNSTELSQVKADNEYALRCFLSVGETLAPC